MAESGLTQRPAEPPIAGSNPALGSSTRTAVSDERRRRIPNPTRRAKRVSLRFKSGPWLAGRELVSVPTVAERGAKRPARRFCANAVWEPRLLSNGERSEPWSVRRRIETSDGFETTADGVYAIGDVSGPPMFTNSARDETDRLYQHSAAGGDHEPS